MQPSRPPHRSEPRAMDFRVLADHSLDMLTVMDADGVILYKSNAVRRELGYHPCEVVGRNVLDLLHPDDRERAAAALAATAARPRTLHRVEVRFRHRRGEWVTLEAVLCSRLDDPRVRGIVSTSRNITDRKRGEEAMRQSREMLRIIIDAAPVAVVVLESDARIRIWNTAAERIFGWTREEAIGNTLPLFCDDESLEEFRAQIGAALRGEEPEMPSEGPRCRKDGSPVDVRVFTGVLRDAGGHPVGVVRIIEDVSELKRRERELRESGVHLAQAQKLDSIGRLAGGIAHDFNNLLTVIQGNLQLVLPEVPAGSMIREDLEEIGRAAGRAAELTRHLLTFSRKQVLQPRLLDLNASIAGTERMLRRLIGEDIHVQTALHPGLPLVLADPGQVEQVLVNLVLNARDAMPHGGELTLETRLSTMGPRAAALYPHAAEGSPAVMLCVSDTGHGMDAETRSHAFEPFFTTKPVGRGTGLGLATVYGIVKQSGGYVWITSAPGQGTRVEICLPPAPAPAAEPNPLPVAAGGVQPGRGETVLLVEDEPAVRHFAERVLEGAGYRVLSAAHASQALARAQEAAAPVALLLTDVVMPGLSGPVLAERLAALHPGLRVLFTSGYADDAMSHHGALDEGVVLLEKPFSVEALLRMVRQVLDAPAP
ncbi:MAG: Blue-light-activated protein [Gemmatimonadetes bacterium]|nr:Blue-light-activated protein [Gemmatimonadota bacterium]